MELAFSIGINITEFWELTPYELRIAVRGYSKRKQSEAEEYAIKHKNLQDLIITHAWLVNNLSRTKRLPKLEKLLDKPKKNETMTDDQMLAQAKMLNQMFGGEVRTDGTEK